MKSLDPEKLSDETRSGFEPDRKEKYQSVSKGTRLYNLASVGLHLLVSIFIGLMIGRYLDSFFGTQPFLMILFIFFGVCSGFLNFYRVASKMNDRDFD